MRLHGVLVQSAAPAAEPFCLPSRTSRRRRRRSGTQAGTQEPAPRRREDAPASVRSPWVPDLRASRLSGKVGRGAGAQGRGVRDHETPGKRFQRSEEHTSELQSLMRISYAVFCLKKKNKTLIQRN